MKKGEKTEKLNLNSRSKDGLSLVYSYSSKLCLQKTTEGGQQPEIDAQGGDAETSNIESIRPDLQGLFDNEE